MIIVLKKYAVLFLFALPVSVSAQELFTYSEPASNMPAKSFAIRSNNFLMKAPTSNGYSYAMAPEIMVGLSKKLMFHAETFFGNDPSVFKFDGASLYAKYRFYSEDDVHTHYRMALYGKAAVSNNKSVQEVIEAGSRNSTAEAGIVATKLINRLALSGGSSFIRNLDQQPNSISGPVAINFNLAAGKLLLPVTYKDYNQVNMNVMFEMLGQTNLRSGHSFIDLAPSMQFIFLSRLRVDAGYRFPVLGTASRISEKAFLLRLEYNFFSVFK